MSSFRSLVALVAVLLPGFSLQAQEISQHAREAARTIRELRTIPIPTFEGGGGDPPARVPNLLRQLNLELRDLIITVLNDPHRDTLADEKMVFDELKKAGWGDISRSRWSAYGEISNITFDWLTDHDPSLLIAITELWVPCGSSDPDASIYVFEKKGKNWDLILATDADYDSAGHRSDDAMRYVLSPPDQHGKWFLGIANTMSNCRSDPDEVRFRILRPGPSIENPTILMDRREPIINRFDAPFNVSADEDKFSMTLGKERRLDGQLGISISRFDVQGNQITRVPPLALSPEDFLDEWVRLDWGEVAPWSSESRRIDLKAWHLRLNGLVRDSTEFEFVQPCPKQGRDESTWLIGLWIDQQQNRNTPDGRLYISISERMGAFFIDGIERTRRPGCPGNTRPPILPEPELPLW
jgi:hypothetical protein